MNIQDTIREVKRRTPIPPRRRAANKQWVQPAWAVRTLVEEDNWGITDAVRAVVEVHNFHPPGAAFRSIRAAYYNIKKLPAHQP